MNITDDNTPPDPALDEVAAALRSKDLLLFVGAGIPAAAGLPTWGRLVDVLILHAANLTVRQDLLDEAKFLRSRDQFIDALSALEHAIGPSEFASTLERHLDDAKLDVPPLATLLANLAPHLKAVITTNLDRFLERAFPQDWEPFSRATPDTASRRRYILKLHGTLRDRSTWIFTREQYDRALYNSPVHRDVFDTLLRAGPVLFVGFGLADEDLDAILGRVRAISGQQPTRHFALVPQESITPYRRLKLDQSGVRLVAYPNADGTHKDLARLVSLLLHRTTSPASDSVAQTAAAAPLPVTQPQRPDVLEASDAARKILRDNPFGWDIKFFVQVLTDAFSEAYERKRDLDLGISIGPSVQMDPSQLFGWCGAQFASLLRVIESLEQLINVAFGEAMGPVGIPANPRQLFYVARKIGSAYREAIEWSLRWRSLHVDDECQGMISLAATYSLEIVAELTRWSEELASKIRAIPDVKPDGIDGTGIVIETRIALTAPPKEALSAEIERLGNFYSRRRR